MVLQQFYMIHNINIIRSICFFFHWIFFRNSLLIKINIVSTTSFGQRSIWQVHFFFFFCQKHMTTTELVINQQAPTLVWWHCFFLILMLREPYLSMRCPDGGCICLSVSIFFSKVLSTTLFFWSLSPQTMFNIIIQVYLYGSGAVYTC